MGPLHTTTITTMPPFYESVACLLAVAHVISRSIHTVQEIYPEFGLLADGHGQKAGRDIPHTHIHLKESIHESGSRINVVAAAAAAAIFQWCSRCCQPHPWTNFVGMMFHVPISTQITRGWLMPTTHDPGDLIAQ
ncbi:hypothetical protein BCR42DRAFT_411543 [Absidia repens]|uniref:Uncharacterized protein n=1 Tax=Absidia repens TaxID=90262 RepID=A0A1X2ILW6_9FUNG|nr:hypothetical protein BCR42DRAFT_411543 [Absidia repens]